MTPKNKAQFSVDLMKEAVLDLPRYEAEWRFGCSDA